MIELLKGCPFCGEEPFFAATRIVCSGCGAIGPESNRALSLAERTAAWNASADPMRKVKLPQHHYRSYTMMPDENGRWLDRDDVIAALKAANVEIES